MSVDSEIKRLADAAVDIAKITNPDVRHRGGFWLHNELVNLYEDHLFTQEQRLDFMAVVKIMLDVIFRDAVENSDDMTEFRTPGASSFDAVVNQISQEVARDA